MASILHVDVPASETALYSTFEALPDVYFELETVVSVEEGSELPGVWISGHSQQAIETALHTDPTVVAFQYITSDGERLLYDMDLTEEATSIKSLIEGEQGTVLTIAGENGRWELSLRFPSREQLTRAHHQMEEAGVSPMVQRVVELTDGNADTIGLTEKQREALTHAIEAGFFKIPREITLEQLADEMGISHQALSERLRRGTETMATAELGVYDGATTDSGKQTRRP